MILFPEFLQLFINILISRSLQTVVKTAAHLKHLLLSYQYRRCPNLRDLLIKAQLPTDRNNSHSHNSTPSSFRCGRPQCLTCPYILDGIKQYTFFSIGEIRSIKSHLDCNTKYLIYDSM